jgi:hypothetical protein
VGESERSEREKRMTVGTEGREKQEGDVRGKERRERSGREQSVTERRNVCPKGLGVLREKREEEDKGRRVK